MRVEILGCSGSISGNLRTTCLLVDDNILVDAGTGAGELSLAQVIDISTLFLTHSHLDHCALLPMLADVAGNFRETPLNVRALPETIAAVRRHLLNNEIWPDYTALPSPEHPYITFTPIEQGESAELAGRRFTALPTRHSVPCVGYRADSGKASLVYGGDSTFCEDFWHALDRMPNLEYLLIENTFLNANREDARRSGHMTAELLARGMHMLRRPPQLFIAHMEAGRENDTMQEVLQAVAEFNPIELKRGMVFEL